MHNPTAGHEVHSRERLESILVAGGHEVIYQSMKDADWKEALLKPSDLVAVAGGDGTVRKVFKELAKAPKTATLLPVGTANNVARSLGFEDDDAERLVRGWPDGARRPYDLGEVASPSAETRFVEAMGGGIFGEVLERAEASEEDPSGEEKIEQGLRLLHEVLDRARPLRWELDVDGVDLSGALLGVEVMNVREIGPNVPLAPEADPGDGMLDVVLVGPDDRATLGAYLEARLRGRDPEPPRLETHRTRRLAMRAPDGCPTHVDDVLWPEGAQRRDGRATVASAGRVRLDVLRPG
jgi:diacylglycerol kinase family enzyme